MQKNYQCPGYQYYTMPYMGMYQPYMGPGMYHHMQYPGMHLYPGMEMYVMIQEMYEMVKAIYELEYPAEE